MGKPLKRVGPRVDEAAETWLSLEPVSKICSGTLQEAPAYETAADFEERFVNVGQPFVSNSESAKPMQPSDGALHHPAGLAQAAAVRGPAPCDLGLDTQGQERRTMRVGIVSTVSLHQLGLSPRSTALASNGRDGLNQRQQLGHVVAIGLGQNDRERNALRVDEEVMLRAGTTAIGWVRSSFFPAPRARIEELSATAREKSMRSAWRSFESITWCRRFHTPVRCQAFSRRQQVTPEPQPIARGSIFQGMPERSTNTIPVSVARSDTRGRPRPIRVRLLPLGSSGSIMLHNSSSISGFGIAPLEGKQCRR